jgi:hypothetical protein
MEDIHPDSDEGSWSSAYPYASYQEMGAESYKRRARRVILDAQIIMGSDVIEPIRQAFIRNGLI